MKMFVMCLAVVVAVVGVAEASPLLGEGRCEYGPSYWCSHIAVAQECNALDYCINKAWGIDDASDLNNQACDYCKDIVTVIRNMVAGNATEKDVEDFLKTVCKFIPVKIARDMCLEAEKSLPTIFDMIRQGLSSKLICDAIGLCGNNFVVVTRVPEQQVEEEEPIVEEVETTEVGDSVLCEACEMLITEVQAMLKDNATVQELEDLINEICEQLGEMEDTCKSYVKQYLPLVIIYIESQQPQVLCAAIGLCDSDIDSLTEWVGLVRVAFDLRQASGSEMMDLIPADELTAVDDSGPECVLCEFIMKELDTVLRDQATQQEIEAALQQVCTYLPASIATECKEFIDEYATEIFELLVDVMDPDTVCARLKLCTSTITADLGDTECVLCEFILKELDSMLSNKATQQEIEQALEKVCTYLPSSITAQCTSFVDQYGPMVIQLLVNEIETAQVCQLIGMCPTQKVVKEVVTPVVPLEASPQCVLCEFIMKEVDSLLANNATESEIIAALDKVCSLLPSSISAECKSFIDEYGKAILDLLVQELNPALVCTVLGLCAGDTVYGKPAPLNIDPAIECELCELVFMFTKMLVEEENETIEHALEKVCNFIAPDKTSQCNELVSKYWSILVDILTKTIDPKEVCKTLNVCPTTVDNLVGIDQCTYGPSYWCASKDHAVQCNALSHCMKHVWSL